jgi:iron complex outermembrane receptor protein
MNRTAAAVLLISTALASKVSAQETTPDTRSPSTTSRADIVVTARRRVELQRDVPVSVESFSGDQLSTAKITQIIDLQTRVPTLTISYGQVSPFLLVRGFGTGNNLSFDQAVGKFIDNVSFGRDNDIRLPLFDLERVEVLKGPQVLLYGNSSTAGALNITTRSPGKDFAADLTTAYEFNANESVTQGGITLPISEAVGLRLSGLYQDLRKGPTYNTVNGRRNTTRNYAARAVLLVQPAPGLQFRLKAEYDHLRDRGTTLEPITQPIGLNFYPETVLNGVTTSGVDMPPLFARNYNGVNNATFQLDINYDALGGRWTSTTAYRDMRFAGSVPNPDIFPLFNGYQAYDYSQFSQELRYGGTFGNLDVTAGGFYQHEKLFLQVIVGANLAPAGLPVPPFNFSFEMPEKTDSKSLFADFTYHLTPQFSIEAGARYSWILRRADQSAFASDIIPDIGFNLPDSANTPNPALAGAFGIFFFGSSPHLYTNLRATNRFFQPQVVAQYKFAEKNQVYAKFVKGDKAGGFDGLYSGSPGNVRPEGALFAPEKATSYEAGIKGLILDNTLNYAVSLFSTTFKNLQTSAFVGAATVSVVTNVGKARSRGVEVELDYSPVPGLTLRAAGNYIDAKYVNFPGAPCTRAQTALLAPNAACTQDLSGAPTPFASKWTGSLGLDYQQPIGGYVLGLGANATGRSGYNVSTNNEPLLDQKGYILVDANISLKPESGPWSLSLFTRNLGDKQYKEAGGLVPGLPGALGAVISRGRQIGLRAGVNF